jgi:hypothetical protein
MEATELRIGNNVLRHGVVVNVGARSIFDIWDNSGINILGYKPIPLTEEWLIKLGFEKTEGWDDMIFWRIHVNGQTFDLEENLQGYEYDMWIIVRHVHQLQNLFYSLTGTELSLAKNKTETNNSNETES